MKMTRYGYSGKARASVIQFGGLNRTAGIAQGQWSEMRGLATSALPQMRTHPGRELVRTYAGTVQGLAAVAAGLACVAGGSLYIDGTAVLTGLSAGNKTILQFWSKVCVFPDKKYYDVTSGTTGAIGTGTYPEAGSAPNIDYAVVHDNRIFGLKDKTLYACKPGDLTDWTTFVDADGNPADNGAYALEAAGAGSFTGITSYDGHVIAFQENRMRMLYGTMPSNYTFVEACAFGCRDNRSIALTRESIFFLGNGGVMRFAGSVPSPCGIELGENITGAIGAGDERNYYMAAGKLLYAYDTYTAAWSVVTETAADIAGLAVRAGILYAVCADGKLYQFGGVAIDAFYGVLAEVIGDIAKRKTLVRLDMRYQLGTGATLKVEASCDGKDYVELCEIEQSDGGGGIHTRRLHLPKCRRYALKISGTGTVTLYEIQETVHIGYNADTGRFGL